MPSSPKPTSRLRAIQRSGEMGSNCHVYIGQKSLFTDNSTANLGVPHNPALSYYHETEPDEFGYVPNAAGEAAVDLAVWRFPAQS